MNGFKSRHGFTGGASWRLPVALTLFGLLAAGAGPARSAGDPVTIEGALVNPHQTANVGSEVSGRVARFHFDEGDFIKAGQVVVEMDGRRFEVLARRAASARTARQLELKGLSEEEAVREKLLSLHAATELSVMSTENRRAVARARLAEAEEELRLAQLDVEACLVRAPFSGYLAVRYKQPHEPVERLEKLFALVDSSKVRIVGNMPQESLGRISTGGQAVFSHEGQSFTGRIERLAKLLDPQSKTKRAYVLIDNAGGELEVGMVGTLELQVP